MAGLDLRSLQFLVKGSYVCARLTVASVMTAARLATKTNFIDPLLKALHHHSNPLPAADARRCQPVLLLPPPQLIEQRDHEPRPGRSQRMSQCDRSAVHIYSFAIEAQ